MPNAAYVHYSLCRKTSFDRNKSKYNFYERENTMIYISPSLLAADYTKLGEEVKRVEDAGANYLHLDVMDGNFVPNISFGQGLIASLRKSSMLIFDVHLMIIKPERYIDDFIKAGSDIITFHYEAVENPREILTYLKEHEVKAGISISPATPVEEILPLVEEGLCDMVLIMTVVPGFGGQKLIPETLDKVRKLRRFANRLGIPLNIEVDGGINADNVGLCTSAGANVIVAGTAIFGAKKTQAVIKAMRQTARDYPFAE